MADRSSNAASPIHADAARLGAGVGLLLFAVVAGRASRLLIRVEVGRLLGPGTLGLYDLSWTIVYMLALLVPVGMPAAVVRYGVPLWNSDRAGLRLLVNKAAFFAVGLATLVGAALFSAARPIAEGIFRHPEMAHMLRVMAPIIPLGAGLNVLVAATRASGRMRYTAFARDLTQAPTHLLVFILLWMLGYGLDSALIGATVSFACAFAMAFWLARRLIPGGGVAIAKRPHLHQLLRFAVPVALTEMLGLYLLWVDRLLVGYFRPAAELGAYAAAAQFAALFSLVQAVLNTVFSSLLVDLHDRGETERVAELFKIDTKWSAYLSLPLAVVFVIAPGAVLAGTFGAGFSLGAPVLTVLTIGQLVNILTGPVGVILVMTGRQRRWLLLTACSISLNVILDVLWLPRYGVMGAAYASALALLVMFGGGTLSVFGLYHMWPVDRRFWRLVPPALAAAAATVVVRLLPLRSPFLAAALIILAAYGTALAARQLLPRDPEDRHAFATIMQQARRLTGSGDESSQ